MRLAEQRSNPRSVAIARPPQRASSRSRTAGSPVLLVETGAPVAVERATSGACSLCGNLRPGQDLQTAGAAAPLVVFVGKEVVVMLEAGGPAALVAPRPHLPSLSTDPVAAGPVLAALRKAATAVQEGYRTAGAMVEPTDMPGARGHACYRVVPTLPSLAAVPPVGTTALDVAQLAASIADVGDGFGPENDVPLGWRVVPRGGAAASPED